MGVKVLFKNVVKLFGNKKFQLLAISVIIFLSSLIYTTMFLATESLGDAIGDIQSNYNLEDFSIDSYDVLYPEELSLIDSGLPENFDYSLEALYHLDQKSFDRVVAARMKKFEDEFSNSDYDLMVREYQDVLFEGNHTFRVYKNSDTINRTYLEQGVLPSDDDEIGINEIYAKKNNLTIGDRIEINDKEYEITAFILFPDYNLPITNNQFIIDSSKNGVALVIDEEFDDLEGRFGFYISGIYSGATTKNDFETNVVDEFDLDDVPGLTAITLTENQTRSGAIYEEIAGGQVMTLTIALNISLIAVIVVAIITYRILISQKSQLGLLKSLGYRNSEIALPYLILVAIISLPMLLVGHLVGNFAGYYMKLMYLDFYMLPNTPISGDLSVMVTSIAVPFVFISGLSYLVIYRMLNKKALDLLRPHSSNKVNFITRLVTRVLANAKASIKFKYSYLTQSFGKLAVFIIGLFFVSCLLIISTTFVGFVEKSTTDYYQSKDYRYEAYLDFTKAIPKVEPGSEKFIDAQALLFESQVAIKGIAADNELFRLYDRSGNEVTTKVTTGVVVNRALATEYDLKVDQEIELEIQNEIYHSKISAIAGNYYAPTLYMEIGTLSEAIVGNESLFTGVYSKTTLDQNQYQVVVAKDEIIEQASNMQGFMTVAIYSMIISAVVIAVLILYILTSLTVEENYYSISLLKVIGYDRKELRAMVLRSYLVYCIGIYLITIPVAVTMINLMVEYMVKEFNMYMPFEFNPLLTAAGLLLMVVIYLLGTFNAARKIRQVPLQEVLKAYQE